MRQAPAVRVALRQGGGWGAVQAALYAAAAAVFVAWCALRIDIGATPAAIGACCAAALAATAAVLLLPAGPAILNWSGSQWSLERGGVDIEIARADVMLDLGAILLLRLRATGSSGRDGIWLAVTQRQAGASFALLCTALYAARPV